MNTQFLITGNRNVTVIHDGQTYSIGASHPNHAAVLDALREERFEDLPNLLDIPRAISRFSEGQVTVEGGNVLYNGELVHNVIATRIVEFMREGLPFKPLVRFLENLMTNPSRRAVEELYPFLENEGMAITDDGHFVAYKGVGNNYLDIHSGTFDNSPGVVHEMSRNLVDDDARRACSNGFHVGSQRYAANWGSRVMLVKVNPADAVSVPYDSSEKLRVCRYEVIREVSSTYVERNLLVDPFEEGRLAAENNVECNPYALGTESYVQWQNGWNDWLDESKDFLEDVTAEGYSDCLNGFDIDENPYDVDEIEYQAWLAGWHSAASEYDPKTGRRRGPGGRFLPSNG